MNTGGDWSSDRWVRTKVKELLMQLAREPDNKYSKEDLYESHLSDWPRAKYDQLVDGVIRHSDILEWETDHKEVIHLTDTDDIIEYRDKLRENGENPLRFATTQ